MEPINVNELPKERAQEMWEKVRAQKYAFDDFTMGRPEAFLSMLFAPCNENFDVEGKGLISLQNILPGQGAQVHLIVWDDTLGPRPILHALKAILHRAFAKYELVRIGAGIPDFNQQAKRLTLLAGFKYEGTIRRGMLFEGHHHDVLLYGILRGEFEGKEGVQ